MHADDPTPAPGLETRRSFLKKTVLTSAALAGARLGPLAAATAQATPTFTDAAGIVHTDPWYKWARRWGHTSITERDPAHYDIAWWREEWRRTKIQAVVIDAGGIVEFFPVLPPYEQAKYLNNFDLFGALTKAAREEHLIVLARMDSSGAKQMAFDANPDWFTVDAKGQHYLGRGLYIPCVNSPYYSVWIGNMIRMVLKVYRPDGFVDTSWSGLPRDLICYCQNCVTAFFKKYKLDLPPKKDWEDPTYRTWLDWNYGLRLTLWDANNNLTRSAGGKDCLWLGMNDGTVEVQAANFRDVREICHRSEIIYLDYQRRTDRTGVQANGEAGKLYHQMLGWQKPVAESQAMYDLADPVFRGVTKPESEVRLWTLDGYAGGIQPSWHYVGAYGEDRRMYPTPVSLFKWHETQEDFLYNRVPMATVGVVWSQRNNDYFGRDHAELMVNLPQRGITQALLRARIPYVMIHADDLPAKPGPLQLLIFPNLGVMTDPQVKQVQAWVKNGGCVFATGLTSLFDENGDALPDFALSDLFRSQIPDGARVRQEAARVQAAGENVQSYLRLTPEMSPDIDGPKTDGSSDSTVKRHPVLAGFEATNLIPYGGTLVPAHVEPDELDTVTFVPPFQTTPTEEAYMEVTKSDATALVLHSFGTARVAYLLADLDRRYARDNIPDHGDLLANIARWAANDDNAQVCIPLAVSGPGFIDCQLYYQATHLDPITKDRKPPRLILHLVNLTNASTWRAPAEEFIPVGPLDVGIKLPPDILHPVADALVGPKVTNLTVADNWVRFTVATVVDHEVIVVY